MRKHRDNCGINVPFGWRCTCDAQLDPQTPAGHKLGCAWSPTRFCSCGAHDNPQTQPDPQDAPRTAMERAWSAKIDQLQARVAEECRLNAMGQEREARLLARVAELEGEVERLKEEYREDTEVLGDKINDLIDRNKALQADTARLREALKAIRLRAEATDPAIVAAVDEALEPKA